MEESGVNNENIKKIKRHGRRGECLPIRKLWYKLMKARPVALLVGMAARALASRSTKHLGTSNKVK